MAFRLEDIVPWGRSFDEYAAMFALGPGDLEKRILGCGDGPAAFNATLTARGGSVVSADPVYGFPAGDIARRLDEVFDVVLEQTRRNREEFVWTHVRSVEELGRIRMQAMRCFLEDFERGKQEGRYVSAELPVLPFDDARFDLALVSHLLFLYSAHLDLDFHVNSLRELCRVSSEVRVFPLLELGSVRSRHLEAVLSRLASEGYAVEIERVGYEFQRGGNEMLRVSSAG
ncbi:hypothetical protein [Fundidesulfovibrio terrae]|uniref:hypothetical protein n=1 Tax=Fundidesulfovibrio terrae TaxID=2922866 RepID=UPI001FAEE289|nr:hypothetical protein [Fundidesulfovibrio terrae]